jgi:hypothetical protein
MPQTSSFQATRRTWFDFAASFGTLKVNRTGIMIGNGDIESSAMRAVVFDESEKRRAIEHHGEAMQNIGRKTFFVRFVEQHRVWTVMTTASARDTISAVGIGRCFERGERHGRTLIGLPAFALGFAQDLIERRGGQNTQPHFFQLFLRCRLHPGNDVCG